MAGTFSVNDHPVTILFDSGASHTFISKECAIRLGLKIENMLSPYNIHSPGGQLITNQIVRRVPLRLQEKIFITTSRNVHINDDYLVTFRSFITKHALSVMMFRDLS